MTPGAFRFGGARRRFELDDPLLAKQVLYQLSYDPKLGVGLADAYKERSNLRF